MSFPRINKKKTGENIKLLCQQRGISVSDLQRVLFIGSNQAIYYWFNGRNLPSLETLCALSKILNVRMEDIIVFDK